MAHEIIMPALGMAQETGTIVAWKKKVGDRVKASDVVMEIETDKTTVEIEAGHDGFLTALRAEAGVPVPVGQVVAIISENAEDVGEAPAEPAVPPPAPEPLPSVETKPQPVAATAPEPAPARPTPASDGRILASPKARRLAKERGIDLDRLVRLGTIQPLHASDIEKAAPAIGGGAYAPESLLRASIGKEAFDHFLEWIRSEAEIPLDGLNVWAAFAAAAVRKAKGLGEEAEIVVHAARLGDDLETVTLRDPDQSGLAAIRPGEAAGEPAIAVLDLTGTSLVEYRSGDASALRLTISNPAGSPMLDIALAFDPAALALRDALTLLRDVAARAEQPLRHLI